MIEVSSERAFQRVNQANQIILSDLDIRVADLISHETRPRGKENVLENEGTCEQGQQLT